jgi:hypothetical protein
MSHLSRPVSRVLALFVSVAALFVVSQPGCSDGGSVTTVEAPKVDPKASVARPGREVKKDMRTAAEK